MNHFPTFTKRVTRDVWRNTVFVLQYHIYLCTSRSWSQYWWYCLMWWKWGSWNNVLRAWDTVPRSSRLRSWDAWSREYLWEKVTYLRKKWIRQPAPWTHWWFEENKIRSTGPRNRFDSWWHMHRSTRISRRWRREEHRSTRIVQSLQVLHALSRLPQRRRERSPSRLWYRPVLELWTLVVLTDRMAADPKESPERSVDKGFPEGISRQPAAVGL